MKFILKEDLVLEVSNYRQVLLHKGFEVEPNEKDECIIPVGDNHIWSKEEVISSGLFDIIEPPKTESNIDLRIEEVPEGDDDVIRKWRIQLDITTSKKKLIEFERIFRESIEKIK